MRIPCKKLFVFLTILTISLSLIYEVGENNKLRLGKSTITDQSTEANDGTRYGGLPVTGPFGTDQALDLYLSNKEYVNIPNDTTLNFGTEDWSINIWVKKKFESSINGEVLLSKVGTILSGATEPFTYPDDYDSDGYLVQLRAGGTLWLQKNADLTAIIDYNILKYLESNLTDEATNPVMTATEAWEGTVVAEQSDFKISSNLYWRWYRGGYPNTYVGFATSTDGITWTKDVGNPIDLTPTIAAGHAMFPYVVQDGANFYMFVTDNTNALADNTLASEVYLFNVTDPTNPVVMNNGNPVLTATGTDDYYIYNVGVCIVNGVWHMLYETSSISNRGLFHLNYAYSSLIELNWTIHKSPLNPVISPSGACPMMTYVPERDAILVLHPRYSGTGDVWYMSSTMAYLTDDLKSPASWHLGQTLKYSTVHHADASLCLNFNDTYPLMMSWGYDQVSIYQTYSAMTLTEFFDSLLWDSTVFHMLTLTNSSGTLKFYIDSVLRVTDTWDGEVAVTKPLTFGRVSYYDQAGYSDSGWLTAQIGKIRIDKGSALSQSDINDLYAGSTVAETNTVLSLLFEEEPAYTDDDPAAQDYSTFWQNALNDFKKRFGSNSTIVVRYALRMHGRDQTTGQMTREYEDMGNIEMITYTKGSQRTAYTAGYFVRLDAVGLTGDVVREGDKLESMDGTIYRVANLQPQKAGNTVELWVCDLEELPFKEM